MTWLQDEATAKLFVKRFFQSVSGLLALGFALAGPVGLNPFLHQLIEHGGHGPLHTHFDPAACSNALSDWHDDGNGHLHQDRLAFPVIEFRPQRPFSHAHEFELPVVPLIRLSGVLLQLFQDATPAPFGSQNPADHHHHSLSQMLLSGLLDHCMDAPVQFVSASVFFLNPVSEVSPRNRDWDSQTLGRGPPGARS